ncbi:hypothetical protein CTI12_AA160660 [Artemisia annua]|uniref:Uncharacterized protein n=1 Tax=Artemisia annua TaxID=35608 RepID=A0A2U1PEC6_ARTAN|nr:hypothetical protein CTI12_AA160650 [Artemisia annua]PWA84152.1 hypothetical protein CTI12_AA160660 [Artemisia annua]
MDPMEFALLMNDSKSNFDPYEYMEEMQEKISLHCSDHDLPIAAAPVALSDDDSQDHKSSHRRELKMMNNCAWSPWQRARFSAVRAYDHLRLENEKLGVGNSHMMDPMEFALLINKSDASFDPYEYMEEMQERITPDERAKKIADMQEKKNRLHSSDYDEGDFPTDVAVSDDVKHKSCIDLENKNIEELLSTFELYLLIPLRSRIRTKRLLRL